MVIMEFDDVMTLEEAAERWKKTSDVLRQNCLGRVKNGFRKGEYRKSGRVWLGTRAGMERGYGKEIRGKREGENNMAVERPPGRSSELTLPYICFYN